MSQFTDIVTAIKTRLELIPGAGKVFPYQRQATTRAAFLNMFRYSVTNEDHVRGWMIRRTTITAEPGNAFGEVKRRHHFMLVGFTSFVDDDNTYTAFQSLVELIMNDLDKRKNLGLSYVMDYDIEPCQLLSFGEDEVGGFLCHAAEIELVVSTVQAVTYE